MTALAMRVRRWAGIWISTIGSARIRARAGGRPSKPISTTCRVRWQHEGAADAVASLRPGYARPARHHGIGTACVSTGRESTYRNRNAVATNRATSMILLLAGLNTASHGPSAILQGRADRRLSMVGQVSSFCSTIWRTTRATDF